jgi:hypothetical protein
MRKIEENKIEEYKYILNSISKENLVVSAESKSYEDRQADFSLKKDEDDHRLKQKIARFLIRFLTVQTAIIFVLIFFQGFALYSFNLNDYLFYILIAGTIIENYLLVRIIVEHLFPKMN